jgi:hypothetical protein
MFMVKLPFLDGFFILHLIFLRPARRRVEARSVPSRWPRRGVGLNLGNVVNPMPSPIDMLGIVYGIG